MTLALNKPTMQQFNYAIFSNVPANTLGNLRPDAGILRSREPRRMQNAPTGGYATRKKEYASASPPTTIFLRAATGEAMCAIADVAGCVLAAGSRTKARNSHLFIYVEVRACTLTTPR